MSVDIDISLNQIVFFLFIHRVDFQYVWLEVVFHLRGVLRFTTMAAGVQCVMMGELDTVYYNVLNHM